MKTYNIIAPEKRDFCVCSCLQAILEFEKIKISQEEISKKLTSGNKGFKIHDGEIKRFLFKKGFDYIFNWHNETLLNEPELILEDMKKEQNHGLIGINDHAYLFYDFNYQGLKLIDPNDKQIKTRNYDQIIKEMHNTEGCFALVKKLN